MTIDSSSEPFYRLGYVSVLPVSGGYQFSSRLLNVIQFTPTFPAGLKKVLIISTNTQRAKIPKVAFPLNATVIFRKLAYLLDGLLSEVF